ncbi:MAG: carboxypeptidase regulatory-like domain-containing protein [Planctomycetota bacterium]
MTTARQMDCPTRGRAGTLILTTWLAVSAVALVSWQYLGRDTDAPPPALGGDRSSGGVIATDGVSPAGNEKRLVTPVGPSPDTGLLLEGRVLYPDGQPALEGAILVEIPDATAFPIGSDGTFVTRVAAVHLRELGHDSADENRETVRVWAQVPGYAPVSCLAKRSDDGRQLVAELELTRSRVLRGRVEDPEGAPVEGASIMSPHGGTPPLAFQARSDDRGEFTLAVTPSPESRVRVQHFPRWIERWESVPESVGAGGPADVGWVVRLSPARWLRARLPVAVGAVELEHASTTPDFVRLEDDGVETTWLLGNLNADGGHGQVRIPDCLPVPVVWPPGTGEHDLGEIRLERGSELEVVVLDRAGQPIPDAKVSIVAEFGSRVGTTDANGLARLCGLLFGPAEVMASAVGYSLISRAVFIDEQATAVQLILDPSARIRGTILGWDGLPAVGAEVSVPEFTRSGWILCDSESDEDGRFEIDVEPERAIELTVSRDGSLDARFEVEPIAPGSTHDLGELHLERGGGVEGRVTAEDGTPVEGAIVYAHSGGEWTRFRDSACETDGHFQITGLSAGPYQLRVRTPLGFVQAELVLVEVRAGTNEIVNFVLQPRPLHRGRVVLATGEPAKGAQVRIESSAGSELATVDEDGGFTVATPEGPVAATVSLNGLERVCRAQTCSELPDPLALPAGARVHVKVEIVGTALTAPVSRERATLWSIVERGVAVLVEGPDGLYTLWAHVDPRVPHEFSPLAPGRTRVGVDMSHPSLAFATSTPTSLDLVTGEVANVVLRLELGALSNRLSVQVVDEAGQPLARSHVEIFGRLGVTETAWTPAEGSVAVSLPPKAWLLVTRFGRAPAFLTGPFATGDTGSVVVELTPESRLIVHLDGLEEAQGADPRVSVERCVSELGRSAGGRGLCCSGVTPSFDEQPVTTEAEVWALLDATRLAIERADGGWEFCGLAAGRFAVRVTLGRVTVLEEEVELGVAETRELRLAVPSVLDVVVRVTMDGNLVTDGNLDVIHGSSSESFPIELVAPGTFKARLPKAGLYAFHYERGGHRVFRDTRNVVASGTIDLRLDCQRIRFRCLDHEGRPMPGARVDIQSIKNVFRSLAGFADGNGEFELEISDLGWYRWRTSRSVPGHADGGELEITRNTGVVDLIHEQLGVVRFEFPEGGDDDEYDVSLRDPPSPFKHFSVTPRLGLCSLPVGSQRLLIIGPRHYAVQAVEVTADGTTTLSPTWRALVRLTVAIPPGWFESLGVQSLAATDVTLIPTDPAGRAYLDPSLSLEEFHYRATPGDFRLRVTEGPRVLFELPVTVPGDGEALIDLR